MKVVSRKPRLLMIQKALGRFHTRAATRASSQKRRTKLRMRLQRPIQTRHRRRIGTNERGGAPVDRGVFGAKGDASTTRIRNRRYRGDVDASRSFFRRPYHESLRSCCETHRMDRYGLPRIAEDSRRCGRQDAAVLVDGFGFWASEWRSLRGPPRIASQYPSLAWYQQDICNAMQCNAIQYTSR